MYIAHTCKYKHINEVFFLFRIPKIIHSKFFDNYKYVQYILKKQEFIKDVLLYLHFLYNIL